MAYRVGIILALVMLAFATVVGLDRDRAFYPTVMIVIAWYYILFAVIGGSGNALLVESLIGGAFMLLAVVGFKRNLWWVSEALFAHGILDLFHGRLVTNPGVPVWWPAFCATWDVVAAGFLAWLLTRSRPALTPRLSTSPTEIEGPAVR